MLLLIVVLMLSILFLNWLREMSKGMSSSFKDLCARLFSSSKDESQVVMSGNASPDVELAVQYDPVFSMPEAIATPLVVKHLDQGRATLILRYRTRKQACTGHLIVWSGAKRRRIQDSYYDLGLIARGQVDAEVINEFLVLAKEKLVELKTAGQRKRQKKAVAVELLPESAVAVQSVVVEPVVVAEPEVSTILDKSIKLKKFPSIYRGIILEAGVMKQSQNGAEFETYGVKFKSPDGVEGTVFGRNLRLALKEAMAEVGDHVEILKIGRQTVEEGRAPMNLFQVSKIAASVTLQ